MKQAKSFYTFFVCIPRVPKTILTHLAAFPGLPFTISQDTWWSSRRMLPALLKRTKVVLGTQKFWLIRNALWPWPILNKTLEGAFFCCIQFLRLHRARVIREGYKKIIVSVFLRPQKNSRSLSSFHFIVGYQFSNCYYFISGLGALQERSGNLRERGWNLNNPMHPLALFSSLLKFLNTSPLV